MLCRRASRGGRPRGAGLSEARGLGIVLQDDHFLDRKRWDFDTTPAERYPLLLHFHPLEIYRHQVIKQTDVVLATYLVGDNFTDDEKGRTFDYYDALTTGDSSLSASIQRVMASKIGHADRRAGTSRDAGRCSKGR